MPDNRPNTTSNNNNSNNRNRGPSNTSTPTNKNGYNTNVQTNSGTPSPVVSTIPVPVTAPTPHPSSVAPTTQPVIPTQQQQPLSSAKKNSFSQNPTSNTSTIPTSNPTAPAPSSTTNSSSSNQPKPSLRWAPGKEFVPSFGTKTTTTSVAPTSVKEFVPSNFTPISVAPTPVAFANHPSTTILPSSKNIPPESVASDYQKAAASLGRPSSAIDSHQLESHPKTFIPYHSNSRPVHLTANAVPFNPVPITAPHTAPIPAPVSVAPLPAAPTIAVEPKKKALAIVDPDTGKDILTNTQVLDVTKIPKEEPKPETKPAEVKVETKPTAVVITEETPKKEEPLVAKEEPKKVEEPKKAEEPKEEPKMEQKPEEVKPEEPKKEEKPEEKKEKKFEKLTIEVTPAKHIKAQELSSTSTTEEDFEDSFYPKEDAEDGTNMQEPPTPTTPALKYRYTRDDMKRLDKGVIDSSLKEKFSALIGPGKPESAKTPRSPMSESPSPGGKGKFGSYSKNTGFVGGRGGKLQTRGGKQARSAKTPVTAASVGLKTAENAWKAGKVKDEEDKIIKEVKYILNLLTPEKYDILIKNFLVIKIQSETLLTKVIDCVFEIAIIQPSYCEMYAKLCRDLSKSSELKIVDENAPQTEQTSEQQQMAAANIFRRKLLNKCQAEYNESIKRVKEMHQPAPPAEEQPQENGEVKQEVESSEEKEAKLKKRRIGIMTLIGELFVKQMLVEKIMIDVILDLVHAKDNGVPYPEEIEMATKLITIIGKTFETLKDTKEKKEDAERLNKFMNFVFQKLQSLSTEKSYPSRIRFSLIDVVELRSNNWVPRLKQEKAKKIDEVLQDIEKERAEKLKKVQDSRGQTGGRRGDRGSSRSLYVSSSNTSSSNNLYEIEKKNKQEKDLQAKKKREEEEEEEEDQPEEEEVREVSDEEEEEDISQSVLEQKVKAEINSYFEDGDMASVLKGLKVYLQKKRTETVIIAIKVTVLKNEQSIKDFISLMNTLINDEESISGSKFAECVIEALKQILSEDLLEDNPNIPKSLGTLCGLAHSIDNRNFSFDFIDTLITKVQPSSVVLIVDVVSHVIKARLSSNADAKAILKEVSSSKLNFIHYINPSKSSDVESCITKMHNADGSEKFEPISYVMFSIKEEKISAEKLSEWTRDLLEISPKAGAKILLAIITFCEAFTTFGSGRLKLTETPEKLLDKYKPVFELVLTKDGQYDELFTELNIYGMRIEFKNEVLKRVFSFLKELKVKPNVENLKKRTDIAQELKHLL